MSLKAFHLFFIAVSIVLAVGFAAWGISRFVDVGDGGALVMGVVSAAGGFVMVLYGLRVRRKLAALGPGGEE